MTADNQTSYPDKSSSHLLVVAGILRQAEKVLLTQRPVGKFMAGMWELPGGKVESGEDPRDALRRELREELGIEVVVADPFEVVFHRYGEFDVLLLFFECHQTGGTITAHDNQSFRWVDLGYLDDLPVLPADQGVIDRLRTNAQRQLPGSASV